MAVKINSGDLKHTITFRKPTVTQNDEGGREKSFTDYLTTKAAIKETSQFRTENPSALLHTKQFIIRYSKDRTAITKDYLIVYGSDAYTINEIENMAEDSRFIKFIAKVKSNG